MTPSGGSPVSRAQSRLDAYRESETFRETPDLKNVHVGIGGGDADSLYVGITFLPGGTNGVCLSWSETVALERLLLMAADAIRAEQVR